MKPPAHLYIILLTVVVIAMAWITGQLDNRPIQIIIVALALLSGIALLVGRMLHKKKAARDPTKKSHLNFGHRERKSGLTWGGGNIKASEAKRGTKRKFLSS